MGFFKKKHDPLSERARALQKQIAALEAQISQLSTQEQTDLPANGQAPGTNAPARPAAPAPVPRPQLPKAEEPPRLAKPEIPAAPPAPELPSAQQPRLRSTTLPRGQSAPAASPASPAPPPPSEPIFEEVARNPFKVPADTTPKPGQKSKELGVRTPSLTAFWERLKYQFRGPATSNPKLVSYLAAGSLQGLRPLRYEKRVARNRAIFLIAVLFLALWWVVVILVRR